MLFRSQSVDRLHIAFQRVLNLSEAPQVVQLLLHEALLVILHLNKDALSALVARSSELVPENLVRLLGQGLTTYLGGHGPSRLSRLSSGLHHSPVHDTR